ncbi:hypothetical protein KBY82_08785 [Cyanobium sp. AMD-g]|uniref:hypothetical protein n=1 Tax=Cyanobium sp. AMD-g TaxID=2823699 RepID=UPI0020CE09DF|nr:hypothetical protein [Cyanobium sp. AMD-g]MCP9930879.1 hypothetical protein [Cyanobium sp. AMD-g]
MAFTSFDVLFDSSVAGTSTSSTGVKGKMTFNFTKNSNNQYILDLDVFNTSPKLGNPSGTLVGFALNLPGKDSDTPSIKLLNYDPLSSPFTERYTPDKLGGIGDFSFCARSTGGSNCNGGNPQAGLADGESAKVRFTLASNLASVDSAEAVTKSFFDLFNTWNPDPNAPKDKDNGAQVALRFQQVTTTDGISGQSEKVGGRPGNPPEAPGDDVPGPLPVLGVATAFGFSRKLRRRITAASRKTDVSD